ncbi:DNA-binding protein [Burkholderia ubonensis]|uniref:DNA-binding protein n=1 Tax=Burkholderia ubonensis TaxID=101571 RepID=UPI00075293D8|nr:DNA-binding protein [Burkholderia ubonensis]KVQ16514.1 DNA-binding protein [Burkholderia ubonensis]KVW40531.1 DNA-binding protein [Burkholderia ubonensis]KVW70820.1 DNA-binding protein [Burkholderia ubonensis]KVZ21022.1 DNA-binding protein [Burkholderia ubonensis]KWD04377.1 DNA-binding protein [Burkholderia ubonensis]
MTVLLSATQTNTRRPITTDELAELLSIRPQSIRKRYCQTGAYFSLRPVKMPNGRLMWPADALDKLAEG